MTSCLRGNLQGLFMRWLEAESNSRRGRGLQQTWNNRRKIEVEGDIDWGQDSWRKAGKNPRVRQLWLALKTELHLGCSCEECTEDVHSCLRAQPNLSLRELENEGENKTVLALFTYGTSISYSVYTIKKYALKIIIKCHSPLGSGTFSLIS